MLSIICHYNDRTELEEKLLKSMTEPHQLIVRRGFRNITQAYIYAEQEATGDYLVFAHQDVGLPTPWLKRCEVILRELTQFDPSWGVAGVIGTWANDLGQQQYFGNVRDTFEYRQFGSTAARWHRVQTLDGMLVILRRSHDPVRRIPPCWDPKVPGFHGYAEDLCLSAWNAARPVYALNLYTEHWCDHTDLETNNGYQAARQYVTEKWRDKLSGKAIVTTTGIWRL